MTVRPVRAVFVQPWAERYGGAEEMLWMFLRYADRSEVEPAVAFLKDGPFAEEVSSLGVPTIVLDAGRVRNIARVVSTQRRLARWLDELSAAVVIGWLPKMQIYAGPAARFAKRDVVSLWWQHSIVERHWTDRIATALPARAVGASSYASARSQELLLKPRRETFVVHPGVETTMRIDPAHREAARQRHGLPKDAVVIAIVGRLQPWKGQDRFVRALAALSDRGHRPYGLIVGGPAFGLSPEYGPEVERLVAELGLADRVIFTGQVDRPLDVVVAADILVNASEKENLSLAILEGMSLGLPHVAVGDGGSGESVLDGVAGLLVPKPDPELIADQLARLIADPSLRLALGEGARDRVESHFNAQRLAAELGRNIVDYAISDHGGDS